MKSGRSVTNFSPGFNKNPLSQLVGSGGGSSSQRPPVESPDSLVSIGYARIVDLISEGEIKGLVAGSESVFLDNTPARAGGVDNFQGFAYEERTGTQEQSHLSGFPAVESNISVGTQIKTDESYTRAVSNIEVSALRVNFRTPRLARQNLDTGDTTGYFIGYAIDIAEGSGPFVLAAQGMMSGKTVGGYDRSVRVDLPGRPAGGWRVRVRRTTPDSETSNIASDLYVTSVSEIIDSKFRYPNSAVIGLSFDASTFGGSIPSRGYLIEGRIIRVPSNYDPVTREYSGVWNGADWKLEYTNNPVWCYLDLLLHPRYGLGDRLTMANVDRFSLYQIAQYCDELVDNGKGGREPRFTLNTYLQTRAEAFKLLQDLASVFRGISYWGAGLAQTSADMPSDPVFTYTNANVIEGKFNYKGAKRSARYTAATVSYNDPEDRYKLKTEYVENQRALARHGLRKADVSAFGCTSQGQAQRAGQWLLLTNELEQDAVSFSVALDYMFVYPGAVIKIADNDRAGRRIGGRVVSATRDAVVVDSVAPIASGSTISCNMPDGSMEVRNVFGSDGNTIFVNPSFSAAPQSDAVFAVENPDLMTQLYRVVGISENGPLQYSISAIQHEPQKYSAIDSGTLINPRPISNLPSALQAAPTNLRIYSDYQIDQFAAVTTITIAWDAPANAAHYDVEWRRDQSDWVFGGRVGTTELSISGVFAGSYDVRVKAINAMGITSVWAYLNDEQVDGKPNDLVAPIDFRTTPEIFAIRVEWGFPAGQNDIKYTEIQVSDNSSGEPLQTQFLIAFPDSSHVHTNMFAGAEKYFRARFVDTTGNRGPWTDWTVGISSVDVPQILDSLAGKITSTELGGELVSEIEKISGDGPGSVNDRVQQRVDAINNQINILQGQIADLEGAGEYDPNSGGYLQGAIVKFSGALYRAKTNVPEGIPPTNAIYWEKVGDYASLAEAVTALSFELRDVQIVIDSLTGQVEAQASSMQGLRAIWRDDDANGELAGAMEAYESRAEFIEEVRVRASQNQAMAQRLTSFEVQLGDANARLTEFEQVLVTETQALSQRMLLMDAKIGENTASIVQTDRAVADLDGSFTESMSQIGSRFNATEQQIALTNTNLISAEADIAQINTTVTNLSGSTAQSVNELSARIQTNTNGVNGLNGRVNWAEATIQVNQQAIAEVDGRLKATYTIRVGVTQNGQYYAAGMAVGVENTQSGIQSQVLFLANRFALLNMNNGVVSTPFVIENGQTIINTALIGEATINFGKISDTLRSINYAANVRGWGIFKNGYAEFHNIYARGNIEASTLQVNAANIVRTLNIAGGAVTSMIYSARSGNGIVARANMVTSPNINATVYNIHALTTSPIEMVPGASGVVIDVSFVVWANPSCNVFFDLYRGDGKLLGTAGGSAAGDLATRLTATFFDDDPFTITTYRLMIRSGSNDNGRGDGAFNFGGLTITCTGGKR